MARSAALAALPTHPLDVARLAAPAVMLLVLGALVVWPVVGLLGHGLLTPLAAWPWRIALATLAVALATALGALVPALLVALTLMRVDIPGRTTVWQVFRLGIMMPPFIIALALLVLTGPRSGSLSGFAAIVVAQALAFLPYAVALLVRALASVPVELEQAAEMLGARRATIVRRVTLGLAGPGMLRAALVVLGLSLSDVATPLLLGGDARVLTTVIVAAATIDPRAAAGAALTLAGLAFAVTLAGGAWRSGGAAARDRAVLPRLERPAPPALRWPLGVAVWGVATVLAGLWAVVPLASLRPVGGSGVSLAHWAAVATAAGAGAVRNSVLLGLGVAVVGTALGLGTAWIVERRRTPLGRAVGILARLPIAVPGAVAGVGYALVLGAPPATLAGTLPVLMAIVACWELPVTSRAARDVLVSADRSAEEAAVGLGAGSLTTLTRVVAPALRPVAGWMLGYLFAAAVLAVGTVIVLAGPGRDLGALTMLALAAAGATGAACAVATSLLALAGGAVLLGRAIAGRRRGPTLFA
jgi:iron(III) transport system permease protein